VAALNKKTGASGRTEKTARASAWRQGIGDLRVKGSELGKLKGDKRPEPGGHRGEDPEASRTERGTGNTARDVRVRDAGWTTTYCREQRRGERARSKSPCS